MNNSKSARRIQPAESTVVEDRGDLRKYRIELPNLLDDLGLSAYAFRLYVHLKRRAGGGGGACFEGARRMAEHCKMSVGQVVNSKRELEAAGLITITPGDPKTSTPDRISITDIWAQNFAHFQPCSPGEQGGVHVVNTPVHGAAHPRSPDEHPCSPGEHKKEPKEERTKEERTHTHLRAVGAPVAADAGVCVCRTPHGSEFCDEQRIALAGTQPTIRNAGSYAMSKDVRGGRDDLLFRRWREASAPEAVEQARTAPPDNRMPYGAALQLVGSVVSSVGPGAAAAEIARLFESGQIGEQTRDRLAARPWDVVTGGDGGGAREAHRSHHPMDDATGVG